MTEVGNYYFSLNFIRNKKSSTKQKKKIFFEEIEFLHKLDRKMIFLQPFTGINKIIGNNFNITLVKHYGMALLCANN